MTITNITVMRKFEILRDLAKYDTDTRSEQCYWKNGTDRLAQYRVDTKPQFVKKKSHAISVKHNKTKGNKMRYMPVIFYGMERCT